MNSALFLLDHASVLSALRGLRRVDRRLFLKSLGTRDFLFISGRCHCFILFIKVFQQFLHDVRLFLLAFINDSRITEGLLNSSFANILNIRIDTTIAVHHTDPFVTVRNL